MQPFFKEFQRLLPRKVDVSKTIKNTSGKMLDAVVDSLFQFVDIPSLPSQKNFLPVEEIGELVEVTCTSGEIPADFAEGVFIRNGSNPLFGGLKSAVSIFGESHHTWVEGEGMLHALYFKRDDDRGSWVISYKNRYLETETFKIETKLNKPGFLPALAGDAPAIIAAFLLNSLRFGAVNKHMSNTNVFEHSGKVYTIAENYVPQEVDISTLETVCNWDVNGTWDRPFTSHPKKAPSSGELVVMGTDARKPYYVLGVISADGNKVHQVDLNLKRSVLSHDIGVTPQYNVIIDHPLIVDVKRLVMGGQLMKYVKEEYARIGVMPRYGDAESVKWFEVQTNCTFHILNCFEDDDQVIVRGCRALTSFLPGADGSRNPYEWFSKGFNFAGDHHDSAEVGYLFVHLYEWRLNMLSGEVEERKLTGSEYSLDFPFINEQFTGLKHKYGYTQVIDSRASSLCGMAKYGSLAKIYLEESNSTKFVEGRGGNLFPKVEYHKFEDNNFCSGSVFVPRNGGIKEDDGWIITFVHNEGTDVTQVHIIDAQDFEGETIAKLTMPQRVPYGFHGTFVSTPACQS
ncbi:PREDICTED: carotenoid 9,10(9',10')-cleavage dioxygenase 1-like [Fragaria vesca subsp. vesca]|uniref:carotenoid 9,10(9',10')-cleavage dioxygenase 1-like n=1 Tax=Fragaria vesca subsp. vesca TaxID=101020 RepID=UPI0002C2FA6D|nr:PREDICTED: carotenoid 9,10(9',10')-cleavage dioxygenase 1-like [Fragaria vesca subsp. vesca]